MNRTSTSKRTKANFQRPTTRPKIRVVSTADKHIHLSNTKTTKQMASTMFAQAIDALVAERDRVFIERVANDYNLPLEELKAKYLETAEAAIKVPRKYKKREPKAVLVVTEGGAPAPAPKAKAEKKTCEALTSKKEPCKFSALKGEVFCKRHLKQSLSQDEPKSTGKVAVTQPVHNHPLAEKASAQCDLCESHGEPLAEVGEFEVATVTERLAAMMAEADEYEAESEGDSESGSDSDEDLTALIEECYADE